MERDQPTQLRREVERLSKVLALQNRQFIEMAEQSRRVKAEAEEYRIALSICAKERADLLERVARAESQRDRLIASLQGAGV